MILIDKRKYILLYSVKLFYGLLTFYLESDKFTFLILSS